MKFFERLRDMARVQDDRGRFADIESEQRQTAKHKARSATGSNSEELTVLGCAGVSLAAVLLGSVAVLTWILMFYALLRMFMTAPGRTQLALFVTMLAGIFAFVGGPLQYLSLVRGGERRMRTRLAAKRLLQQHCGACDYDLAATTPASDGCFICSECGAAWRVDLWKRDWERRNEWRRHRVSNDQRVWLLDRFSGSLLIDRKKSERRSILLKSLCANFFVPGRLDVLLVIAIAVTVLISTFFGKVGPYALWMTLKPVLPLMVLFALSLRGIWALLSVSSRPAMNALSANLCPHCENPLRPEPSHGDNARLCTHCGAAWPAKR